MFVVSPLTYSPTDENLVRARNAMGAVVILNAIRQFSDDRSILINGCASLWQVIADGTLRPLLLFAPYLHAASVFEFRGEPSASLRPWGIRTY